MKSCGIQDGNKCPSCNGREREGLGMKNGNTKFKGHKERMDLSYDGNGFG